MMTLVLRYIMFQLGSTSSYVCFTKQLKLDHLISISISHDGATT